MKLNLLPALAAIALILTPADRDFLISSISARTPDSTLAERVELCTTVLELLAEPSSPSTAAGVLDSVLDKSAAPPEPSAEDIRLTAAALNQALAKINLAEEKKSGSSGG